MKVIFLDIDGVMNNIHKWPKTAGRQWIDPVAVKLLNQITEATGAVLVISSTWRRFWDVEKILTKAGVKAKIVGRTPFLSSQPRGYEIESWLAKYDTDKFIILDDDTDMGNVGYALIKTQWDIGLEPCHVKRAIAKLK